jgi:hypothetical protein
MAGVHFRRDNDPRAPTAETGTGGEGMAAEVKRLVQEMDALIEEVEQVHGVLRRYTTVSAELVGQVQKGLLLTEALDNVQGALRRREVTEAMEQLEAARHRVRLAMFALAHAQGSSASELGRKLGFSRQLAARLANEAASGE